MGRKWTAEQRKNFLATAAKKRAGRANGGPRVVEAISLLKAAERHIASKTIGQLTEAEMLAHMAYKALTEQ